MGGELEDFESFGGRQQPRGRVDIACILVRTDEKGWMFGEYSGPTGNE